MNSKENVQSKEFELLSLGEILLRLSPPDNERLERGSQFEKKIGGAELNVVSGVSQMGLRTGLISRLPENLLGTFARNQIRFCGVSDDYLVYDSSKAARLGVYYYENGVYPRKPRVVYDRKGSSMCGISCEEFPKEMYDAARCFHTSGITLALCKECRETGIEMIRHFKEAGALISFDVNFRGNLWTGEEAKACIEQILPYVDVFFCSEETAHLTFQKEGDVKNILKSFAQDYDISIVAATQRVVHSPKRHTFGSVIYDARVDRFFEEEPYRNIEIVDRVGSGDAYIAGALYGLLAYDGDCQKALEYGNAISAVKNTIPGDLPSLGKKEIETIIRDHQSTGRISEMER